MESTGQDQHILTTEEPIHTNTRHDSLELEIAHLYVLDQSPLVSPTAIENTPRLNTLSSDSSEQDERPWHDPSSSRDTGSDSSEKDELLVQTTEANKHIPYTQDMSESSPNTTEEEETTESDQTPASTQNKEQILVFSEPPSFVEAMDRYIVTTVYGAGPTGTMIIDSHEPRRQSRVYMVACDFSDDSYYAMEWVMGTMMRDGDELHVVAAVNREDNPEAVKKAGLTLKNELKLGSEKVTSMARRALGQMLLYNIKLRTYTIVGRIKDVLYNAILQLPLTLVICGSRGRGPVKELFMGSISTFLVRKSPVPVSVIRRMSSCNKDKPPKKRKKITSPPLRQDDRADGLQS